MVKANTYQVNKVTKSSEAEDCLASLPVEIVRFRVLSPRQAAQLLGLGEATLERMRKLKTGPKHLVLSPRRLGYRVIDLLQWADERASGGNDAA